MSTDDDLRDALRDLAEEWEDDGRLRRLIDRRQEQRRRRRFAVMAASAAAVVLAVVSVVGVLGDGTGEDSVVTDDRDGATPTTITTTTTSTTTPDPSTLRVDNEQAATASAVVEQFLHALRTGDLPGAAQRWSGYGSDLASDDMRGRIAYLDELRGNPEFARILAADEWLSFTTPSWDWVTALPVVTVTLPQDADRPLAAVAFLVDALPFVLGEDDDPEDAARERAAQGGARIQRISLPRSADNLSMPPSGSVVEAGQQIVIPRVPVEGGARAFVDGIEVPVEVDHESLTMTLRIPDAATGNVVVTLSTATPEFPTAEAFAYTVRPS